MEPIITYRLTETGMWSYCFYADRQNIGKATSVLSRSGLVRFESSSESWYSTFHIDTETVPGTSRKVMDDRTGLELFRIIYCEPGFYRVMGVKMNLLVECRDGAYLFGNPGQPALAMTERIREWPWVPEGEPFFQTIPFEEEITEQLLQAMLVFPALKI